LLGFDHPPHVILRLADLLEELLLLIERDGHPPSEHPRDLHIGEPADELLGIALATRTERDLRTLQRRPKHADGQNSRGWSSRSSVARRRSPGRSSCSTPDVLASSS